MVALVALQLRLPAHLALGSRWALPAVEAALMVALTVANPVRMDRASSWFRRTSLLLVAVASVANGASAVLLVDHLVRGRATRSPGGLLFEGAAVYLTNVVTFALWYWELDRGGPLSRKEGRDTDVDFLFPQMASPDVAPADWEPTFPDYLYLSFTNSTAFSPTDTMPWTRWAKMLMLAQSATALCIAALVIARAVNILP
ncbi:uncharacterized protein DUF1345 [Kineococcus rhizosphaerae]|uniref:Uncharacterized protein DUF1345 n=1 Tax=Kineococcus rhizosphaerae TaxID=559628 RepID=A0A2T0QXK3_9ACTN|nr:uncharacterized protein DUF1345 [Kineococcus rhizosphaerae]